MTQLPSDPLSFIDDIVKSSPLQQSLMQSADLVASQSEGGEGVLGYLGEAISETGEQLGGSMVRGAQLGAASFAETLAGMGDPVGTIPTVGRFLQERLPSVEEIGRQLSVEEKQRTPSVFDDYYISPRDLGGVAGSVALSAATIASGGAAAPVTVPALFSQAMSGVFGEYAKSIAENEDVEFDPAVAAGLTAIAALETVGGVGVGIKLPMVLAKKAAARRALGEAATGGALVAAMKKYGISAGSEGLEEVTEEALESLATIMYEPELAGMREAIASGRLTELDIEEMYDLTLRGGFKTFLLGAGGGGVGQAVADVRQRAVDAPAARARRAAEIAAEVRSADVPIGPRAEDVPGEDVSPEDAVPGEVEPVTVADLDKDEFMDRIVAEDPEGVDAILSKPRSRGNTVALWSGIIPEGVRTNREQRQALYDRLKAAKERADSPAVAEDGEVEIGEQIADLRREEDRLVAELTAETDADPNFVDTDEYNDLAARLREVEQERLGLEDREFAAEPEFSTAEPVDAGTLQQEPGTQMGSMPGGVATQPSTGRRFYVKRYPNREQTRNEAVANRLYAAAGVRVPRVSLMTEGGEVVGVASEMVPGVRSGRPTDAGDALVIDAWLANWDVVGMAEDNLLVDADGRAVRIDQGGALTTRAQGAPKGEAFGPTVGEIETLPAMNDALADATPAQMRRGFQALESVTDQDIKNIVKQNSTGDTASDNKLVATLIKRRRDLLSRKDQIIAGADAEFSTSDVDVDLEALNSTREETFTRVTPEQEANLPESVRRVADNARSRLGREVVFVTQTGGPNRNGFVLNRDSNRIYIVVPSDLSGSIAKVAAKRGMSERKVREAYESVMLQTLLHENFHLTEDVDPAIAASAQDILATSVRVRRSRRVAMIAGQLERKEITEEQAARELRAEAATDLEALSQASVEHLFFDRGRLRNTLSRLRQLANRLGGPRDVRTISRIVRTMDRSGRLETSSPGAVHSPADLSVDPEFSSVLEGQPPRGVPYLSFLEAMENPNAENLLDLFASHRAFNIDLESKAKVNQTIVREALDRMGIESDRPMLKYIADNYKDRVKMIAPPVSVESGMILAPAGTTEAALNDLFRENPSPTAEQFEKIPGAPVARQGVVVTNVRYVAKTDTTEEKKAKRRRDFLSNAKPSLEAGGARVAETDDDSKIEGLLKEYDAVVYTDPLAPSIHANGSWTDRAVSTRDYKEIKDATIEAVRDGHHNWYREFGQFMASLGGLEMLDEAAYVFGITSAQSPVEVNLGDTLFVLRAVRQHVLDGKPWTREDLFKSIFKVQRRSKHTKDGTAKPFITKTMANNLTDYYINGPSENKVSQKVRSYAGAIAEAARNNFYPFSVQDRHQAAMYGYMPGDVDATKGIWSQGKLFKVGHHDFRFANYITQRLTMEPELRGLTPSMIQAAQWFYVKSGRSIYEEAITKEDKGAIANFQKNNPDIRTGTIESATRYNEFEMADLREVLGQDVQLPVELTRVPGYEHRVAGSYVTYSAGQAEARRLSDIMRAGGARVNLAGYPIMSAPGLTLPKSPMTEEMMGEVTSGIIGAIAESDGSVSILNDMGIPHTPVIGVTGLMGTQQYTGLQLTPMVGSIKDPAVARVIGAVVGLGTMQPRMATIQHAPDGEAVTLRVRLADGGKMTGQQADLLSQSLAVLGKGEAEVVQTQIPNGDMVEVTIVPKSGSIENDTVATKFEQVRKELSNGGIEVRAQAVRTKYESIQQSDYAGIIAGSGVSGGDPSGLLGRVLREVATPTLSVLEASGFGFDPAAFAQGSGIDQSLVPNVEFSTADTGLMPLEEQNRMRVEGTDVVIDDEQSRLADTIMKENQWWFSLSEEERSVLEMWSREALVPHQSYDGLDAVVRRAQVTNTKGPAPYLMLRLFGSFDSGSFHADSGLLGVYGSPLMPSLPLDREGRDKHRQEVARAIGIGIEEALTILGPEGVSQSADDLYFDSEGNPRDMRGGLVFSPDRELLVPLPEGMDPDEWSNYKEFQGKGYINLGGLYGIGTGVADVVDLVIQHMVGSNTLKEPLLIRREIARPIAALLARTGTTGEQMRSIAPLYDLLLSGLSKAPKVKSRSMYRGHFMKIGEFKSRFSVGDTFMIASPASMTTQVDTAISFATRGMQSPPASYYSNLILGSSTDVIAAEERRNVPIMFQIQTETARIAAPMTDEPYMATDENPSTPTRTISGSLRYEPGSRFDEDSELAKKILPPRDDSGKFEIPYSSSSVRAVATLQKEGLVDPLDADDLLRAMSQAKIKPSATSRAETEVIAMPGTVYEVTGIDDRGLVSIVETDKPAMAVMPEFSSEPDSEAVVEPELSTSTPKSAAHDVKFRNKAIRRTVQDRFIELDYLQRDIEEAFGAGLDITEDAINALRLMPGQVAHRSERFAKRVAEPLARDIAMAGLTQAEFGEYCCAVHALDVNRELGASSSAAAAGVIDSGLSDATAQQIIDAMRSRSDIDTKTLDKLHARMVGIGRQNLRLSRRSGLISDEEFENLQDIYPNYVPFWDAFDKDTDRATSEGGEQFTVPSAILKARTGRVADSLKGNSKFFEDRLAAVADQRFRIIRKSANNEALKRLLKLTGKVGNDVLEIFTPGLTSVRLKDGRIGAVPDNSWRNDPTVFRVMVDGQQVLLRVKNEGLAKAMRSKQRDPGVLAKVLLWPLQTYTSVFRFFTTQFGNPDFTFTNPARDVQTGAAAVIGDNTRLSAYKGGKAKGLTMVDRARIVVRAGINLPLAWGAVWGLGTESSLRDYAKYRALGARQGFYSAQDPAKSREQLRRAVARGSAVTGSEAALYRGRQAVTLPVREFARLWEHVNTMFDDGIRFAAYRQLVREGVLPEKAAETTRDLTVDFSRMGTAGPIVNGMNAYANAAVQGTTKTLRLLKSPAGQVVFTSYFLAGLLSELWNDDEEDRDGNLKSDWEEIPEYQRDGNLHIRLPEGFGSDGEEAGYVKLPVAYGLGVPFVAGRRLARLVRGKESFGEAALGTASATVNQFVPFGAGAVLSAEDRDDFINSSARVLAPDILDPVIGLATNRDWLNNSIYNEPFPTDPLPVPSEMGRDRTDEWSKGLSSMVNTLTGGSDVEPGAISFQPEILPYLLSAQFSGTYKTFERAADMYGKYAQRQWIEAKYPNEAEELLEESSYDDTPILRRFMTTSPKPRDLGRSYYEYRDLAREADAMLRANAEAGYEERVEEILETRMPDLTIVGITKEIDKARKSMRDLKKSMRSAGVDEQEIDIEMRRYAAAIRNMQQTAVQIRREEERRAKAEAGSN